MEKKIIYAASDSERYSRERYEEFCQDMGYPCSGSDDEAYFDWVDDTIDQEREYFNQVLGHQEINLNPVLITGTVETWTGRHEICPTIEDDWFHAEERMMRDAYTSELEMLSDQTFKMTVVHHDGTNVFIFHFLKEDYRWDDPSSLKLDDEELYESIPEDEI